MEIDNTTLKEFELTLKLMDSRKIWWQSGAIATSLFKKYSSERHWKTRYLRLYHDSSSNFRITWGRHKNDGDNTDVYSFKAAFSKIHSLYIQNPVNYGINIRTTI